MSRMRVVSSILLSMGCASVAAAADRFEEIRSYIRAELVRRSVPSISVAVARDGKILWEEGFGWADREQRIPATQHTVYSLASISKPFTATGLMTLVQAGKIDLNEPINAYLGNAKLRARVGDAREATVLRVANHTSGLPSHVNFFYVDERAQRPSMDETILRYGNLVTVPGERFTYSNLGYGLLDYVIERASGVSYGEFMRREVFVPLGLTRTSIDIDPALRPYSATRYDVDGRALPFYGFDHPGASAVYSSAHDLVRFGMFHLKAHLPDQKAILSDASIDRMQHNRASGGADRYSIGFESYERNGQRSLGHSGGMPGVSTWMQLFPKQKLAVVVLGNGTWGRPSLVDDTSDRIVDELLSERRPAPKFEPARTEPFVTPDSLLGTWHGTLETYVKDVPVELRFLPEGQVHARFGDRLIALVNDPRFKNGEFRGRLDSRIGTPDTERCPYIIELSLELRGEILTGEAAADGEADPSHRGCFRLSHWLQLSRQPLRVAEETFAGEARGPYETGTFEELWEFDALDDPSTADPRDRRKVMVQAWYPATLPKHPRPAPYAISPQLYAKDEWFQKLGDVRTRSYLHAPMAASPERFPVLIYNHGAGNPHFSGTFQTEFLASHGYVVLAIGHSGANGIERFPDGTAYRNDGVRWMATPPEGEKLTPRDEFEQRWGRSDLSLYIEDISAALDRLASLDANPRHRFHHRLDLDRVASLGWSLGGFVSLQAARDEPRIKAAVNLDGWPYGLLGPNGVVTRGSERPVLVMFTASNAEAGVPTHPGGEVDAAQVEAGRAATSYYWTMLGRSTADWFYLTLARTHHEHFSDYTLFEASDPSWLQPGTAHAIVNAYTLEFLDKYVRGSSRATPLLSGNRNFPEATLLRRMKARDVAADRDR